MPFEVGVSKSKESFTVTKSMIRNVTGGIKGACDINIA